MDGYKIIDFKGVDLADSPTIPGIYNAIDESNKPLVIANLVYSAMPFKPFFTNLYAKVESGDDYMYRFPLPDSYALYVNDDDSVVFQTE